MDKAVPVTGASSGIGAGIARKSAAAAGAKVMLATRRADRLKDLAAEAMRSRRASALVRPTAAAH